MVIAYLRVSTCKRMLDNQRNEITKFTDGRNLRVDRWVTEIVSGKKEGRERKLGALIKRLQYGDTLIITEMSSLSRTVTDIMSIVGELLRKRVHLYSIKDRYVFDDTINSNVLCFAFGLIAELERNLISSRTREALALRRSQGITLGRKKGSYTKLLFLIDRRREIVQALNSGRSIVSICNEYGVARTTFERFRRQYIYSICKNGKIRWRVNGHIAHPRHTVADDTVGAVDGIRKKPLRNVSVAATVATVAEKPNSCNEPWD